MAHVPDRFRYELQRAEGDHDPQIGYQWAPIAGSATTEEPMFDLMVRFVVDPDSEPAPALRVVILTHELGGAWTETVIGYCGVPE